MRRFHYCASSFLYHPSASAAALSHHYILSLNSIFRNGSKGCAFLPSALKRRLHHGIMTLSVFSFLFCTQGHCCTPSRRQAAPVWQRLPTSLGAQCQSRAEEENSSVGQRAVMSKTIQEGWRREGEDPACTPSWAKLQRNRKSISLPDSTQLVPFSQYMTENERSKPFSFLCLDPLKSPHLWKQVIVLLAQFLQPSDATDCNRLHL